MESFLEATKLQTNFKGTWIIEPSLPSALIFATVAIIFIKVSLKLLKSCISPNETVHKNTVKAKQRSIPKLPSLPVIGALYPLLWTDFGKLFTSWMSNYGTTFQSRLFGRDVVVLSDPIYLQKLLASSEPGHLLKYPLIYETLFPGVMKTGLIATSNIPDWKHNRSILSKAFSLESLKAYITVFNRHAKKLITEMCEDEIDNSLRKNDTKSLHAMLRESTFDTTTEIILGTNTLSNEGKLKYHENFARCQDIMSYRYYHPWCLIESIWKFHPKKKEMDELTKCLTQMFDRVIQGGRETNNEDQSVKSFIDYMNAAGLDGTQIFAEVSNSFSAAYDTVSIALDYFMFNMALHPKYQEECVKEIDEMFCSLSGSYDEGDRDVTFDALSDLKYLEMCVKESLRIFTPIPVFLRELGVPLNLDGNVVLEKGTLVFITPGLTHRDPQIYPDPVTYNPDRFLPENCKSRSVYSFLPFSQGPRNCIGWKLAIIQIKLFACYILHHYEVYTENSYENLNEVWNTSIWPTKDLGVRWRKRKIIV